MRWYRVLGLGLLLSWSSESLAERVSSLYEANVALLGHGEHAYQAAIEAAFEQVMIKVTGNQFIMTIGDMQNQRSRVNTFVKKDFYVKDESVAADAKAGHLHVEFKAKAIDRMLRSAGQARWGADRPLVGVWLNVAKAGDSAHLLTAEDTSVWSMIQNAAMVRGLPIVLPVSDLSNLGADVVGAVSQENLKQLEQWSKPYATQALLVGNLIRAADGHWSAQWLFVDAGVMHHWRDRNDELHQIIEDGINDIADRLSNRQAILPDLETNQHVLLVVKQLDGIDQYAYLMRGLQRLSVVESARLKGLRPKQLQIEVVIRGTVSALISALQAHSPQCVITQLTEPGIAPQRVELVWHAQGVGAKHV